MDLLSPRFRVLAADAATADGVIPTLALVDELHRHPSGELYGVFRDGLGPRDGKMVTISTAGATMASPLGLLREKAGLLPDFHRDEARKYTRARSADGAFVLHEWSLSTSDDPNDMITAKLANPASWHTIEALQRRHDSPSTTPWQWLRFACGVWTEGEEPWIEPQQWDDLEGEVKLGSEPVRMVVHLGHRAESAAIALVQPADDQVLARVNLYESTTLAFLEETIRSLCEEFNVDSVAYNNRVFQRSAETLQAEGVPMIEFPQSLERMTQVAASFYKLIEEKRLVHDGDPELRVQVLAGRVKEMEQGWRFVEDPRLPRPIVGLIALAIGCFLVEEAPSAAPMFGFA
jgi:phage terminase large subunit-like protein